jgi:hypothetical protein
MLINLVIYLVWCYSVLLPFLCSFSLTTVIACITKQLMDVNCPLAEYVLVPPQHFTSVWTEVHYPHRLGIDSLSLDKIQDFFFLGTRFRHLQSRSLYQTPRRHVPEDVSFFQCKFFLRKILNFDLRDDFGMTIKEF